MKYCFIINPAAGKGEPMDKLASAIKRECDERGADYEIYFTTGVGDATEYVKSVAAKNPVGEISFFACGGDGTLGETVNGVMSVEDGERLSVGTVPSGTGNDFVRNFTESDNFFDIAAQLDGERMDIDLIGCNGKYAINMVNIGFDCEVVCKKEELQKHKWIPSKLAYVIGLVWTLIRKPGVKCRVACDGGELEEKDMLLTTFGNGEYCGGGFRSNPESRIDNGKINVLQVKNISRMKFISIVGEYKKGTHLVHRDILESRMANRINMVFTAPTNVSIDGEVVKIAKELCITAAEKAVRFVVPCGVKYARVANKAEAVCV